MIKFQKESLSSLLPRLTKAVPVKGMDYLKTLWLIPHESSLSFGVHTQDSSFCVRVPAQCSQGEPVGIKDGPRFCQVLAKLPQGEISLSPGKRVLLTQDSRKYSFELSDPSWFMSFPVKSEHDTQIDGAALVEGVAFAQSSLSADTMTDGVMACAYINKEEEGSVVIGFNGFQISMTRCGKTGMENLQGPLLIPNRHLQSFKNILADGMHSCHIDENQHMVITSADMSQAVSIPLFSGDYPDYTAITNIEFNSSALVDKADLEQSLDRLATISGLDGSAVHFAVEPGVVKMSLSSSEGEGLEEIEADTSDEMTTNLQIHTFSALIRALPSSGRVRISIPGPTEPCMVSPEGAEGRVMALFMPVSIETGSETYED